MTRREKFFKTVKRELEGYVPFEFKLCPALLEKFKAKTGREDYADYFEMPLRFIQAKPIYREIDFRNYFDHVEDGVTFDVWGVGHKKGSVEHFTQMLHPLAHFDTIEEFEKFPYPDPNEDFEWDSFSQEVEKIKEQDYIAVAGMAMTIFEIAWYLRGMDELMVDLLVNPHLACYHLDRITEIRCSMAERYAAAAVDMLHLGDDVSTQLDMMMSPKTWREYIKPRLKKVINAAKKVNPAIIIDYHGDGNLQKIIEDLIEIGIDILNPVQPECMDPVKIKELYGDRLSFRGTIGTQSTMPFGTPQEVDEICKEMIQKVGRGGGLILAPTHMLEPEVPWENIEAMIEAIQKYSRL